jgi:hypothetical protein
MRAITEQSQRAFENKEPFNKSNTKVVIEFSKTKLYLHNSLIATFKNDKLYITNQGWATPTTKERLNGLMGRVSIQQKDFMWYLNNEEWDGEWGIDDSKNWVYKKP